MNNNKKIENTVNLTTILGTPSEQFFQEVDDKLTSAFQIVAFMHNKNLSEV